MKGEILTHVNLEKIIISEVELKLKVTQSSL